MTGITRTRIPMKASKFTPTNKEMGHLRRIYAPVTNVPTCTLVIGKNGSVMVKRTGK